MNEQNLSKRICVVVDTNIWLEKPLLRTSTGAALIFSILKGGFKIGLPEIIEKEIIKNIASVTREAIDDIEKGLRIMQTVIGKSPAHHYPSKEAIEDAIKKRLDDLDKMSILERVPMKFEHAKAAVDRLIEGLPPNGPRQQQFKDSLIWEAIKELAKTSDVYFVTKDSGFYSKEKRDVMAVELARECESEGIKINLYKELEDCLKGLKAVSSPVQSGQEEELVKAISEAMKPDLLKDTMVKFLDIGKIRHSRIKTFLTEEPDVIAISYEIEYEGIETSSELSSPRSNISFTVKGDCSFSLSRKEAQDNSIHEVEYCWTDSEGNITRPRSVYVHVGLAGGARMNVFKLREPIENL